MKRHQPPLDTPHTLVLSTEARTWAYLAAPLTGADRLVIPTGSTVRAWWTTSPDGLAIDPSLRVPCRAILPERYWEATFHTRDLVRHLTPRIGQGAFLRIVCAGVAERSVLFHIHGATP